MMMTLANATLTMANYKRNARSLGAANFAGAVIFCVMFALGVSAVTKRTAEEKFMARV